MTEAQILFVAEILLGLAQVAIAYLSGGLVIGFVFACINSRLAERSKTGG